MIFYLGADHRGFKLKEALKKFLKDQAYEIIDFGNDHYDEEDDYPDFAEKVAKVVSRNPDSSYGLVICGSGVGVDIVANRFPNVRCVLGITPDIAAASRTDDNTNVLALAADFTEEAQAKRIISVWLQTSYDKQPRHQRRIEKISAIENRIKNS